VSEGPAQYVRERPIEAIRHGDPWRPFGYYIAALESTLEELSRDLAVPAGGRVLDYGCADAPYHRWFRPDVDVVGADLAGNPAATLVIDEDGRVPCPDASFDAVLSTQVLEHVEDPARYLRECERVLKPGGRLLLSTHGVFYHHPDPVDYWRWTCEGIQHVVADAGMQVERIEGIFGMGATGIQLVVDAIVPKVPARLRSLVFRASHVAISALDRRQSPESKRTNASVFALIAAKRG